jgi:apolipoprotein N-acyltransferase
METRGGLPKRPALLVGGTQVEFTMGESNIYSSALYYGPEGKLVDWYAKRHLVPFGEFIPLAKWFPWVYKIGPLNFGVTPGPEPKSFSIGSARVSPNICFETMVERIPNRDLRWLEKNVTDDLGHPGPNLLVNISNDGWFHGTSILDHHLRCTRAVAAAHHLPILVSANCGLTAWIDGSGRVRKSLPRQTEGFLFAEPLRDERESLYLRVGDRPVWLGVAFVVFLGISGIQDYWRTRRATDRQ